MGSFLFKWNHAASEVYVTGTFDDWSRSVKLDKKDGSRFEKLVELPQAEEKIYYKFVVDDNWTTDPTAPQETDGASNVNNVLEPDQIKKLHPSSTVQDSAIMSNITPQSTMAKLAGNVPKDPSQGQSSFAGSSGLPGSFPETPAHEPSSFSVNPIPETPGPGNPINLQPGEKVPDPSTLTSNTISSTVRDDPEQSGFSVNPIPATSGPGNPINLQPGEKVPDPSTLTSNTISSTVRDDPEQSGFSVNPIPATSGPGNSINLRPGEKVPDPSTFTSNTISSTIRDDREPSSFSVNPIPATSGIGNPINLQPGENVPDPSTLTSNSISSTVRDDPSLASTKAGEDSQQTFGVAPLPATSGFGNPINIQPGETLPDPSTYTQNTINSTVTTDKESYENSSGVPQLPDVVTPQKERDARGGGMFNLPPIGGTMIPESSLPIGSGPSFEQDPGVTIQSVGPQSSTAALAGQVPLEPRSRPKDADIPSKLDTNPTIQSAGPNSTTADLAGQVPLKPRGVPEDKDNLLAQGRDPTIQSVGAKSTTADLAGKVPLEPKGEDSLFAQGRDPTIQSVGATSTTADLAGKVPLEPKGEDNLFAQGRDPTIQSVGATSTTADLAGKVPLEPKDGSKGVHNSTGQGHDVTIQSIGANSTTADLAGKVPLEPKGVPKVVQNSQQESDFGPEATANPEAVKEKFAVEKELESKVPEVPAISKGTGGLATAGAAGSTGKFTERSPLPSHGLPTSVQNSIDEINKGTPIASTVPDVVQESIAKSSQSPEAAGSKIKVDEKYQVEQELLHAVKTDNAIGESAPTTSAALSESAPAATTTGTKTATNLAARPAEKAGGHRRHESREVSPMSHPIQSQTQPVVATGVGASSAPQTSQPTASIPKQTSQPSSSSKPQPTTTGSASTDKKSKRASGFFGKLKQKFSDKSDKDKKSSS